MIYRSLFAFGIFAFAVTGSGASLTFYDYGRDHLYAANVSRIIADIKESGHHQFSPTDFVSGSFDVLNGPLFISFAPPDHVEQRAYFIPKGLSHIEDFETYDIPAILEYGPFFTYFGNAVMSKHGNGFTPKAAEIAAPEFYFYNLTNLFFGENELKDYVVPFVFLAPQHERPESYYLEKNFRKLAEFSLYQPFPPNPLLGLLHNLPGGPPRGDDPLVIINNQESASHLTSSFPDPIIEEIMKPMGLST